MDMNVTSRCLDTDTWRLSVMWDVPHKPISYRGVLVSTLLHATVYIFRQSAECTSTDCKYNSITNCGIY
jgi:hypothetical protein